MFHKILLFHKYVSQNSVQYVVVKMFHVKHYIVVEITKQENVSRETFFCVILQSFCPIHDYLNI